MRILLVGEYRYNMGPANVNKKIIEHMKGDFSYIKFQWPMGLNKILLLPELLVKLYLSQVIIVSVTSRIGYIAGWLCALFHKQLVFIMHGCIDYESEINGNSGSKNGKRWEAYLMEHAALILPVSANYGAWLKDRYPAYKDRIGTWTLGVDPVSGTKNAPKKKGTILVAGGNTPQKNNNEVINAVARMNGAARLEIYGRINPDWPKTEDKSTYWMGQVSHVEFLNRLSDADIFIVNSSRESFSISLMEALCCGCNILVSSNVGALDLLELEESDMINDVHDVDEIQSKIQYLMCHPNHKRIYKKIAWSEISYEKAIEHLREICEVVYTKSGKRKSSTIK